MNHKFFLAKACKGLSIAFLTSTVSFGAVIYESGVTALKATDPFQVGRLNRSGVPSDWSVPKTFPGVLNPTTSYRYETFNIPVSPFPYLQITFNDFAGAGNLFISGYLNSYRPNSTAFNRGLDVNYLGDAGFSSGYYPDSDIFQVALPASSSLVLVVNDTSPIAAGIGDDFRFLVEGFYNTQFNDTTPPAPEPATITLSGAGLAIAGAAVYRRKRKQGSY